MVINGSRLLDAKPIKGMRTTKRQSGGASFGLSEAGYDIRLKQDIRFEPMRNAPPSQCSSFSSNLVYAHHFIDNEMKNGNFALASAIEEFCMPNNLVGIVHDKSTWARHGLSVFNTVIEPMWKGFLTLELVYHGSDSLHLPAGTGIAQVIFHEIAEPAYYEGKYQNQEDRPVTPIRSE